MDPATDRCVVRRRVRCIDGRPGIIWDDYFDEQIVRGTELAEPEDTKRENILAEAGYEQTYDIDEIISRMPTPGRDTAPPDTAGNTSHRAHPHRLHGQRQGRPRDGLDHPG
jgi:hypothetical protein